MKLALAFAFVAALINQANGQTNQTFPIPAGSDIGDSVKVTALLIPPRDVTSLFGKAIARNYAVIQIRVANLSSDHTLLVHDLSIDYSHWILGSCFPDDPRHSDGTQGNPLRGAGFTPSCRVSSMELRAVRQVALEGQVNSARNRTYRGMRTLATLGAGLTVAGGLGPVLPKAVDAFSGAAGIIIGQLLTNGTVEIENADQLGISVETVSQGSDDKTLNFKLKLTKAIPTGTDLKFTVKKTSNGKSLVSGAFTHTVQYGRPGRPLNPCLIPPNLTT